MSQRREDRTCHAHVRELASWHLCFVQRHCVQLTANNQQGRAERHREGGLALLSCHLSKHFSLEKVEGDGSGVRQRAWVGAESLCDGHE